MVRTLKSSNSLAVCMPAFNAEKHIEKAIHSILTQSYSDFRFIITDDCSTDRTVNKIKKFDDTRIVFFQNPENLGTILTRNRMLRYCLDHNYCYMAIMDADDYAFPDRLKKQIEIFENDPSLAVCGSSMKVERKNSIWHAPQEPFKIKVECIFGNPIPTSSATIRLRYMEQYDLLWHQDFAPCADYHLWYLMLYKYNLRARNTGDVDMIYTHSPEGVSHGKGLIRQEIKDADVKKLILKEFSLEPKFKDVFGFMKVVLNRSIDPKDGRPFLNIGKQILKTNNDTIISQHELRQAMNNRAVNYLKKNLNISDDMRKSIYKYLINNPNYLLFAKIEKILNRGKKAILDKYCPNFSHKATILYFLIRNKILPNA